jgi:hypothetical protein
MSSRTAASTAAATASEALSIMYQGAASTSLRKTQDERRIEGFGQVESRRPE